MTELDHISYSSLKEFATHPLLFYKKYITKEIKKEDKSYFAFGSAFEMFLFDRQKFNEQYIVTGFKKKDGKWGDFFNKLVENEGDFDDAVNYSGLEVGIDTIKKKLDDPINRLYMDTYKAARASDKLFISKDDLQKFEDMQYAMKDDPTSFTRGVFEDPLFSEVYYQLPLTFTFNGFRVNLVIDKLTINRNTNTIIIDDLKTTSKLLDNFRETYAFFNYDLQATLYLLAIRYNIDVENDLFKGLSDKTQIDFRFIVVEKDEPHKNCFFYVSEEEKERGGDKLIKLTEDLKWHLSEDKWKYERVYYEQEGKMLL